MEPNYVTKKSRKNDRGPVGYSLPKLDKVFNLDGPTSSIVQNNNKTSS